MLIINLAPSKTTKHKLKYYKLRKCNTLTRLSKYSEFTKPKLLIYSLQRLHVFVKNISIT